MRTLISINSFLLSLLTVLLLLFVLVTPVRADNIADYDAGLKHALREIKGTYGDDVSISAKRKSLYKFGRNDDIGTSFETVWQRGGDETYVTTNLIDSISSSNAGDTQETKVEGHTCTNGIPTTFVVQDVTLQGQTKTSLSTPLCRATRMFNNNSSDFAGTVYVYEDDTVVSGVPQTTAKIHLQATSTDNQTLKAATSTSAQDYWIITEVFVGVDRQNTRSVDFRVQIREPNKVFRTKIALSCNSSAGSCSETFNPPLIVPKSSDLRVRAISSGTSTGVTAALNGYLAIVK